MGTKRMLHKKISVSIQVNSLSEPAQLLYTWLIAHADDDGRLRGEAEYIKATVVPMKRWSFQKIEKSLDEISEAGLIHRWWNENITECYIEFPTWKKHQSIKSDRYKPSDLPSFNDKGGDNMEPIVSQDVSISAPQFNISKHNSNEFNKSEDKGPEVIADKNSIKSIGEALNPHDYEIKSDGELAAQGVWKEFESNNPWAFYTTYLRAHKKGVPAHVIRQFASEMRQDLTIKNPGAIFNKKVDDFLNKKG